MKFNISCLAVAAFIMGVIAAPTPANFNDLPLPPVIEEDTASIE